MKKLISTAALLLAVTLVANANDKHVQATLESVDDSGVSGTVMLTQLPNDVGAVLHVKVSGLEPGATYTSFYYESADCSAPADEFRTFTADGNGNANLTGKIDEDIDEVGSVSVRLGEGYGTLLACAEIDAD